ncbi:P-loop containing nucleoside triphosphate hydrolase protein [Aspergillus foveolatus]|uniref:P-loop containing nucleoside triphosphate hydrolase protein n=1 Tax=Aspergillus foveolatus TaxID=210207 RepID=UPI003CCCCE48
MALTVRMAKSHRDGAGNALTLHSIVVQSPSLKETLSEVFEDKGITSHALKKLVFYAPFHPFIYRWNRLGEILRRQKKRGQAAAAYTQLLIDVLRTRLEGTVAEINNLLHHKIITYSMLWALFEPDVLVVSQVAGHERLFKVRSCEYNDGEGCLKIAARFVDWDGKGFGYVTQDFEIRPFSGDKSIIELDVFPVIFHPSREEVEANATSRGERFRDLCGIRYVAFSGLIRYQVEWKEIARNLDDRVVIDAASYFETDYEHRIALMPLNSDTDAPQIYAVDEQHCHESVTEPEGRQYTMRQREEQRSDARFSEEASSTRITNGSMPILAAPVSGDSHGPMEEVMEEHLRLCSPYVRGFSLKLKRWLEFDLDGITEIKWNDSAFAELMLPPGYRDLVLAFVAGLSNGKEALDDLIEDKGLGVSLLFAGSPGTGKTLTARVIAEELRKPLHILSAGEFEQDPSSVEERLRRTFMLAEKWDAVLLIDECDTLLQERPSERLKHNKIDAVFLRLLEYYRGVMIITTGRADTTDKTLKSRIHFTMHFPELSASARKQIWRQSIARSKAEAAITDKVYDRLSQLPLNGHQIKHVVKIATLLSYQQTQSLGLAQIRTVLSASQEVDAAAIAGI